MDIRVNDDKNINTDQKSEEINNNSDQRSANLKVCFKNFILSTTHESIIEHVKSKIIQASKQGKTSARFTFDTFINFNNSEEQKDITYILKLKFKEFDITLINNESLIGGYSSSIGFTISWCKQLKKYCHDLYVNENNSEIKQDL